MAKRHATELSSDELRWHCDPNQLNFETTAEIDPASRVLGQETAREALLFGIQCDAPGQNIYVRGQRGSGRIRMVRQLLEDLKLETDKKRDRCYVHNFQRPDHPRLITLGPGQAENLQRLMGKFAQFAKDGLKKALDSEPYKSRRDSLKQQVEEKIKKISEPLEKDLAAANMALVSLQQGPLTQTNIFPVVDGQPIPAEQLRVLVAQQKADSAQLENFETHYPEFQKRLQEVAAQVSEEFESGTEQIEAMNELAVRKLIAPLARKVIACVPGDGVREFVDEVVDDIIENRISSDEENQIDLHELYGVNIILTHTDKTSRPVVEEIMPNIMNLMGTVETQWGPGGVSVSDFRGIHGGQLLNADEGFLILDVDELLAEPGAYRGLMRTLRTGLLEIVPPEINWMRPNVVVQPQPIEINVRVILIGDVKSYYALDFHDTDFREQFKVLADFDNELPRGNPTVMQYASVVSYLCAEESLLPFHKTAVAALAEHGARIAARKGKLTARFGRIADLAREASFLAKQANHENVLSEHINQAVKRTKMRASLPSRKFQELVEQGTILVQTTGDCVGQINGLAVIHSGPLTYGFPARITATIGPGRAGLINIEGHAQLSGAIHTKGFHILGGLLRHLLDTEHPLAFSASLAFEQSYGGIDGDSASGAETCCLLSALTNIPIKQSLAMTGAIDQHGHVEAIGGVDEKIEGFFDACNYFGLTGEQGVIIPKSNAGDLMLRQDVVDACRQEKFHVFAVSTIHDALEILTGITAGELKDGQYEPDTVLGQAVDRANEYWRKTLVSPQQLTTVAEFAEPTDEAVGLPRDIDRDFDE